MKRSQGWHPPTRYSKAPSPERTRAPNPEIVRLAEIKRRLRAERNIKIAERRENPCR